VNYGLLPSLFRIVGENKRITKDTEPKDNYSVLSSRQEQYRNRFSAMNYHFVDKGLSNDMDWLEVMQHYCIPTYLLDWSSSAFHALLFALDPLTNHETKPYLGRLNGHISPHVYVCAPNRINHVIAGILLEEDDQKTVRRCINFLDSTDQEKEAVFNKIKQHLTAIEYGSNTSPKAYTTDHMVNFSLLVNNMLAKGNRISKLILEGIVDPLLYLLYVIYFQRAAVTLRYLPPLSIMSYIHSDRIRNQHGAFSLFPNYLNEDNTPFDLLSAGMECNYRIHDFLYKIHIKDPEKMCREAYETGASRSWIYAEPDTISYSIGSY
jgi:hypothetical protein